VSKAYIIAALVLLLGCANIQTKVNNLDKPLADEVKKSVSEWNYRMRVGASAPDEQGVADVILQVERSRECAETRTTFADRTIRTERSLPEGQGMITAYILGISGIAAGAYLATRPYEDDMTSQERDERESERAWGVASVGLGATLLGWGIVEDIRLIDSEEHRGRIMLDTKVTKEECKREPIREEQLELVNADDPTFVLSGTTDDRGRLRARVSASKLRSSGTTFAASIGPIDLGKVSLQRVLALKAEAEKKGREAQAKAEEERRAAALRAEWDAYGQRTGQCHPDRASVFETHYLHGMRSVGAIDALRETEHKIVYASGGGAELSYEPSFTGEYHFIVVAPDDVQLTITKEGAGSRTGSEYESIVAQVLGFGHADSRAMRLGGRDRATIRVRGNGCALLLIFEVSYR
jgi:hypothetical protein